MLEARFEQIAAAKAHFFALGKSYPKIAAQILVFGKAAQADKAKQLPTIRQQVETWLNSFGSLLDTDKTILSAKNEQIAKIAAQLKITVAKKIQTLPDDYKTAADSFIQRFDTLRHKEILTLNANMAEVELIKLLMAENKTKEGIKFIFNSATQTAATPKLKESIENDYKNRITPRLSKLVIYDYLIKSPLLAADANPTAKAAYSTLSGSVVDRMAKIQDFLDKPPRGTSEADLQEAKAMLRQLKSYQKEVSFFVGKEHFTITDSKDEPAAGEGAYDGYIRMAAQNEGKQGLDIVINANKLANVKPKDRDNVRNRIIAHEMQHAVQWNNGKIAYLTNTRNPSLLFYDLTDEVDAIQKEYALYGDDPRNTLFNGSVSINDITVDNQSIAKMYKDISNLTIDLNLGCTVDFIRENNFDNFKDFIDAMIRQQVSAIFSNSNEKTYAGLELKLKDGSGWQAVGGITLKEFLGLLEANYPEIDTKLHYKK
jgi:Effector protein